ncbi:hypothetical protein D3C83_249650 [compost metagenome]
MHNTSSAAVAISSIHTQAPLPVVETGADGGASFAAAGGGAAAAEPSPVTATLTVPVTGCPSFDTMR